MKNTSLPQKLLLSLLAIGCFAARAQNPRLDPAFQPTEVYRPGQVAQVVPQPDGKVLIAGGFTRLNGVAVPGLARLLPTGQPDLVFEANVAGLSAVPYRVILMPGGKILLNGLSRIRLGAVNRLNLLLLNADGTPDASFDAGPLGTPGIQSLAAQPDGKIVLAGLPRVNGQPVGNLARLNANGTLDAGFQAAGPGLDGNARALVVQPDGKILVGGDFMTAQGQPRQGLARLLPSGALDTGFIPSGSLSDVQALGVLPNGNIMVLGQGTAPIFPLARLLPSGALDRAFRPGSNLTSPNGVAYRSTFVVLANGDVLVSLLQGQYNGVGVGPVFRVLPSGSLAPAFNNNLVVTRSFGRAVLAELPNGQLLVAGADLVPTGRRTAVGIVRLNANGSPDAAFDPALFQRGAVRDVALQANGQLVVGGDFTEINGTPAGNLARLDANGTVEVAFTAVAAADGPVKSVLVQPDGRVLATGQFEQVGGSAQRTLARLQANGQRDAGFAPAFGPDSYLYALALQPNGQVLLAGQFQLAGSLGRTRAIGRFDGNTGNYDAGFQPTDTLAINDLLVLPTGQIVVAGSRPEGTNQAQAVWQLLPSGVRDTSFGSELLPQGAFVNSYGSALARSAGGQLYVARLRPVGTSNNYQADVVRLLPNGSTDPAFRTALGRGYATLNTLAVQPNGRVLAGGGLGTGPSATWRGSLRLLPTGAEDLAFDPTYGPGQTVSRIVVQPDGALLMAGDFNDVSGLPVLGLTRLLDPNVLALRPGAAPTTLSAWPVPAHGQLHVAIASPRSVHTLELFDLLGRVVLTRTMSGPAAALPLEGVAPGVYLLRYAAPGEASGSRRIVVD